MPANILLFPNPTGSSDHMASPSAAGKRRSKGFSTAAAKGRAQQMVLDPVAQSRIAELFAMRRDEKAPENFVRDALEVFHRRNAIPGALALPVRAS